MSTFAAGQLFYRRRASPLHAARAGVCAAWSLALIGASLILFDPIVLGALLLAVLGAGAGGIAMARDVLAALDRTSA